MRYAGTVIAMLIVTISSAQDAPSQVENDDAKNDKTHRLFDILADYQLNYEAVESKPYAYVARGTQVNLVKNQATKLDLWFVGVKLSDARRLDASSRTTPSSTGRYLERWSQRLKYDGQLLMRGAIYGDGKTNRYKDSDDEDYKKARERLVVMRPMDQVFSLAGSLTLKGTRNLEPHLNFLADYCTLRSAEYTKKRDIVAEFVFDRPYKPVKKVVFSKPANYLPTDVRMTMELPNGKRTLLSHQIIEWERRDDVELPVVMKASSHLPSGRSEHVETTLDWRFDNELSKDLLDPNAKDWRESTRVLFDVDWQRRGVSPPKAIPFSEEKK